MAHVHADRVADTTTTTGTGAITLSAAPPTGYRTFSAVMTTNDTCYYAIASAASTEWEVGLGTYSSANTLTRTTVLASSNSNNAVSFSAGTKDVFITDPAARDNGTLYGVTTDTAVAKFNGTNGNIQNSGVLIDANNRLTASRLAVSGNISSAAWTTSGLRYANVAATITDTSSTGTVAAAYTNLFTGDTVAASNATTFTDYYQTFIAPPVAGTNVTFTNSWALGLSGGLNIAQGTANANVFKATGYSLTGSNASSMIDLAGTWNTSGTPTALKLNVTDTASNASSLLMDLQVGGSSKLNIDKNGTIVSSRAIPNVIIAPSVGSAAGVAMNVNGIYLMTSSGGYAVALSWAASGAIIFQNQASLNWCSTGSAIATVDLTLSRRGASNLRLGLADAAAPVAQTLSVQSVVAGTTNTAGTDFTITGSQGTGTGAGGKIIFQVAPAGSSGTAQNALATALTIDSAKNISATGSVLSSSATGGIGYATGSGGAVTQATNRTTGVTLNNINGAITLVSAAGTTSWQTFTVTNSTVAATDTVIVSQKSGTDLNQIFVTNVSAGSFKISFATTGGTTTEQPVFNFAVIKAVAA